MKDCTRCGTRETPSTIGSVLLYLVCDYCRRDMSEWDMRKRENGISYTIGAMEAELTHLGSPNSERNDESDN